jgi:hypothetical protein
LVKLNYLKFAKKVAMALRVLGVSDPCRVPMDCDYDDDWGVVYSVEYTRRGGLKKRLRKIFSSDALGPLNVSL